MKKSKHCRPLKLTALAVVVVMMVSLLAGCGAGAASSAPAEAAPSSGSASAPATESTGEKVLYTATVSSGTADKGPFPWYNIGGDISNVVSNSMFRGLLIADSTLQNVSPDLAESYEVSDDSLTYTFTMKDGLKWSDGEALTAEDVAFSLTAILQTSVANGLYTSTFKNIVGADAVVDGSADTLEGVVVDGNKVSITLAQIDSNFLSVMAQFAIMPKHALENLDILDLSNNEYWAQPVTSGRFMITEMNPGNYFTLEQNPNFEGTQAKFTKIINTFVADQITAAKSGQIDYMNSNNVDTVKAMQEMSNMAMYPIDILFYRYFICNMSGTDGNSNSVMQDVRVRQAILYAIDRDTLIPQLWPNMSTIVNSGVPATNAANDGVTYSYDPEKAKELLTEAGYDFNYTFRILYYNNDQTTANFLEGVAYYLGEIGMKVELYLSQQGTTDLFTTRNYDIAYKGLSSFSMIEWYNEYASTSVTFQNIFGGDTAFDAGINDLKVATDDAARTAALKSLQATEQEMMYKLPLFTQGNNVFVNTDHVSVPSDITFGNPLYNFDMKLDQWDIVG